MMRGSTGAMTIRFSDHIMIVRGGFVSQVLFTFTQGKRKRLGRQAQHQQEDQCGALNGFHGRRVCHMTGGKLKAVFT